MATPGTVSEDLIDQFVAVTGVDRDVAVTLLDACAGDLDMAVGMHMDSGGAGGSSLAGQYNGDDDVRAPIPQKTEILVEDEPSRIFQFEESIRGKRSSKKRSLEDLFRPPVDITIKGTFQNVRNIGSSQNKWLLVNVQNVQEFSCQILNRDVWSCTEARNIIKDNFVFWQVYNDSEEGKWYMRFYKLATWPYVAVLDPFTGESQVVWNKITDGKVFCDLVKEFLSVCPVPDQSLVPPLAKRMKRDPSILDASEQEQMEAAIQASLAEDKTKASSPQYIFDSDSEDSSVDEFETFSDSDDVVVSSQPGSSNGASGVKTSAPSGASTSFKSDSLSKLERLKRHQHLSRTQPSSSSSSSPSTPAFASSNSSAIGASNNIQRLSPSANSEPGNSGARGDWSLPSSLQLDNPLDIDMFGCREAEVSTPETVDDSPTNSQLSYPDKELNGETSSRILSHSSDVESLESNSQIENSWTDYWGDLSDPFSKIMIRFPNNKREQVELPWSSQIKALTVFCSNQGFPGDKYELVTNYPRRCLSKMVGSLTLKDIGFHLQETVFVQDL